MSKNILHLKIRRLDTNDKDMMIDLEIDPNITYTELKTKIMETIDIQPGQDKILKIRNSDGMLIPLTSILDPDNKENIVLIDVTKIHQDVPAIPCESPITSVYIDAVRLKLRNMESRVSRVESVVPQLKWRRQSLVEHTTHSLGSRIAFLDRRIDELTPSQWQDYLQKSMS